MDAAEAVTGFLEPFVAASELHNLLALRGRKQSAPFLKRALSYADPRASARGLERSAAHEVSLRLRVPYLPTSAVGEDVLIAALCLRQPDAAAPGGQALFPLCARAVLVPPESGEPHWRTALQLPITLPTAPSEGQLQLELLLVHRRSSELAQLLQAACSAYQQGGSAAGRPPPHGAAKAVTCTLTQQAAFKWIPSGASVLYCSVQPAQPLAPGIGLQEGQAMARVGTLRTHMPPPQLNGMAAQHKGKQQWQQTPYLTLEPQPEEQQGTQLSDKVAHYTLAVTKRSSSRGGGGGTGTSSGKPNGVVGGKRGRDMLEASPSAVPSPLPPPPQKQHQQQGEQPQLLRVYYSSSDGGRTLTTQLHGLCCPFSPCRLRCRHYAGLQHHLLATHGNYHQFHFGEERPGEEVEVFMRCNPAWLDPAGKLLAKESLKASVEDPGLRRVLWDTRLYTQYCYHCPAAQRGWRLAPGARFPEDPLERQLEQAVEERAAALAAAGAAARSHAGPEPSSTATDSRLPSGSVAGEAAAAAPARGRRGGARGPKGGAAAAGSKLARTAGTAAAVARATAQSRPSGVGLALLTPDGRPKFYHSRICVAMSQEELLAEHDSDNDSDPAEWQHDIEEWLNEQAGLSAEERAFMYEWNLYMQQAPIHADADLPDACRGFAARHTERLRGDTPFRRCYLAYLLHLWRFRLLTPQQVQQLTAVLPAVPLAGAPAAPLPQRAP